MRVDDMIMTEVFADLTMREQISGNATRWALALPKISRSYSF